MIIEHIELENWGPHVKLSESIGSHIVGIIGSNGKGKSNLLQAIAYALTGDLAGVKGSLYIHNYGHDDAAKKAVVRLRFRKGDKEGTIERVIKDNGTTTRQLVYGDNTYKAAAEVDKIMSEILGADKAAMQNAVYIKQGDIAKLVKGTPSERQETMIKLMNLSFIEQRSEAVRKKLFSLKAGVKDYSDSKRLLEEAISSAESSAAAAEDVMNENKDCHDMLSSLEFISNKLAERTRLDQAINANNMTIAEVSRIISELVDSAPDLISDTAVKTLQDAYKDLSAKLSSMQAEEATANKLDELLANKATLNNIIVDCDNALASSNIDIETLSAEKVATESMLNIAIEAEALAMQKQAMADEKTEITTSMQTIAAESATLDKDLSDITSAINATIKEVTIGELCTSEVCPVCGGVIDINVVNAAISKVNENKAKLEKQQAELTRISEVRTSNGHALAVLASKASKLASDYEQVVNRLAEIGEIKPSVKIREELENIKKYISTKEAIIQQKGEAVAKLTAIESAIAGLGGAVAHVTPESINAVQNELNSVAAKMKEQSDLLEKINIEKGRLFFEKTALGNNTAEYEKVDALYRDKCKEIGIDANAMTLNGLEEKMIEFRQGSIAYTQAEANKTYAENLRDKSQADLDKVNAEIEKNNDRLSLIDDIQTVLTLTSRTGVPLAYANEVFKAITPDVQDLLAMMQANFTVEPDPDRPLTYRFTRTDDSSGYDMPQERLSGGQAIRLSIAMLAACQQTILPEVGMLILDEPSSHIDAEGVEHMRDMFAGLNSILENTDMQLIVVDHNSILEAAFENVIKL